MVNSRGEESFHSSSDTNSSSVSLVSVHKRGEGRGERMKAYKRAMKNKRIKVELQRS